MIFIRKKITAGGGVNLVPDPGMDDSSRWAAGTGFDVDTTTVSKMEMTSSSTAFSNCLTHTSHLIPVSASTTYDFSLDVDAITGTPRIRIQLKEWNTGIGGSYQFPFDTNTDGTLTAGTPITFQFTTAAGTDEIEVGIQTITAGAVGTFDNMSWIAV